MLSSLTRRHALPAVRSFLPAKASTSKHQNMHCASFPVMRTAGSVHRFSTEPPSSTTKEATAESAETTPGEEEKEEAVEDPTIALKAQLKEQRDQMMRALADAENARTIARRDVENANHFAVTKFAKSLLDVADNLSLALAAIPAEEVEKEGNASLKTLMEGVSMTDTLLSKSFKEHGLVKFGEKGDVFDPNMHDALFQLVDPSLDKGAIGQVLKPGYSLKGRIIRPAQVGTVRDA